VALQREEGVEHAPAGGGVEVFALPGAIDVLEKSEALEAHLVALGDHVLLEAADELRQDLVDIDDQQWRLRVDAKGEELGRERGVGQRLLPLNVDLRLLRCLRRMAKTVLIVEDNELNMKLFGDVLESRGYRTLRTGEGLAALELALAHRPDLILMDIQLPAISGLEVTRWIKAEPALAHIPVVAVTAFAMAGDEQRIREGGCEAYIAKPISIVGFLATIDGFLAQPAPT
jgi:two-component system cell cycle response regulator DivK